MAATPRSCRPRGSAACRAALAFLLVLGAAACTTPAPTPLTPVADTIDQGWDAALAARFHFTPQGSRLIPRAWFLALERADATGRFAAPENLARYGLLQARDDAGTGLNPDNLPIGFAIDPEAQPGTGRWLGLTCAACHTGEVTYRGTRLRIDGAPANADFDRFGADLDAAVQATHADPARLARLATATGTTADALRAPFDDYAARSARHWSVQRSAVEAGLGRVDALGQIINAIAVLDLAAPRAVQDANRRAPRAPVSYPFLWLAPRLEWVQWVPIANSPIGRNSGEVLGVFGEARLTAPGDPQRFASSVRMAELHAMESWLRQLRPPAWPEALFGTIDRARWEEGQRIFATGCQGCHNMPPFRLTDPRQSAAGERHIRISAVPIEVVRTDGDYLAALNGWRIRTGPLADLFAGRAEAWAPEFFQTTVRAVVERGMRDAGFSRRQMIDQGEARACPGGVSRRMAAQIPPPEGRFEAAGVCDLAPGQRLRFTPERWRMPADFLSAMKAGPLLGIWATGPFLHNGSVPTLYDLLSPPEERPPVFWVGGRELDTTRLGFVSDQAPGRFRFDTALPGNSNAGHAMPRGGPLAPAQRLAVIEFLKDPLRFGGRLE